MRSRRRCSPCVVCRWGLTAKTAHTYLIPTLTSAQRTRQRLISSACKPYRPKVPCTYFPPSPRPLCTYLDGARLCTYYAHNYAHTTMRKTWPWSSRTLSTFLRQSWPLSRCKPLGAHFWGTARAANSAIFWRALMYSASVSLAIFATFCRHA